MKKKVLLAGAQDAIFDDFFRHTEEVFSCLTTSNRTNDIQGHISLFEPDVLVYCLGKEATEDNETINFINYCFNTQKQEDHILVLIGDKHQFDGLKEDMLEIVHLQLVKPISIKKIQIQIENVIKEKQVQKELRERELLRMKQEAEAVRKKHLLIVDDDPTMLRTIKMYLEEKYVVATAPSGKFALKFLSQKETDLVLLDYEMPEMSGQEVFQQIKDDEKTNKIPVVFLTGIADTSKIKNVLSMQPQGYLLKPVDYDRLHQTLDGILGA